MKKQKRNSYLKDVRSRNPFSFRFGKSAFRTRHCHWRTLHLAFWMFLIFWTYILSVSNVCLKTVSLESLFKCNFNWTEPFKHEKPFTNNSDQSKDVWSARSIEKKWLNWSAVKCFYIDSILVAYQKLLLLTISYFKNRPWCNIIK